MNRGKNNIRELINGKAGLAKILLIVFYCVGIFGMAYGATREFFITLTPVALLLSLLVMIIYHQTVNLAKEILLFISIFTAGFLIEAAGVNTGRVFGSYTYGEGLGFKVFNTPLLIGINWVLLVWCTAVITDRFKIPVIFKIIVSSVIMVLYDVIMEQVAPAMDMWKFDDGAVPLRNYTSWFLLGVIFHSLVRLSGFRPVNTIAPFVLYTQAGFFAIILIIFKLAR
jgi:putative membrane protein